MILSWVAHFRFPHCSGPACSVILSKGKTTLRGGVPMRSTTIRLVVPIILLAMTALLGAGADKDAKVSQTPMLNGKTLAQWIREIEDRDPSVRENAVRSVPHFGLEARKALPDLIAEFRSTDSGMRANAANAVGLLG